MKLYWIVVGDKTAKGGIVNNGSETDKIEGKPIATLGSKVVYPGGDVDVIVAGADLTTFMSNGQPVALHGAKTAKGDTVLAGLQGLASSEVGSSRGGSGAGGGGSQGGGMAPVTEDKFDEQFHLVHHGTDVPIANTPYRITTASGKVFEGVTDEDGYTGRIQTDAEEDLDIEIFESDEEHVIGDTDATS